MSSSFLGGLPGGLVDELLAAGDRIDVPPGSTIYRNGDYPRAALLVVRGLLRVYMASPQAPTGSTASDPQYPRDTL